MISSIITPVRWYNDIAESDRFSTDCDICKFELITDKTRMLPFQFRRDKSGYQIDKWFLRKQCVDYSTPLLNNNDSNFILDTGIWDLTNFDINNGNASIINQYYGDAYILQPSVIGKNYVIKIVISKLCHGDDFNIRVKIGGITIATINSTGTFNVNFTAIDTSFEFDLECEFNDVVGIIVVDNIQFYELTPFDTLLGDIELNKSDLQLVNIDSEFDLISSNGSNALCQLPCGKYYMIMTSLDGAVHYSELITIKDFIPSQSPYTLIEWKNSCDLSDVVFNAINGTFYLNRLYIDGNLTKPEYPIKEEGEEDGNQNLNITFQKWEKRQSLIVANAPEFIVDALTAIRLHDTVTITPSLRKKQLKVSESFEIEKVESELTSIFNDCATNVELKLLLKNKVVDVTCCENIAFSECLECRKTITSLDTADSGIYFGTPLVPDHFGFYEIEELYATSHSILMDNDGVIGTAFFLEASFGDLTSVYTVGSVINLFRVGVGDIGFRIITGVRFASGQTRITYSGIISDYADVQDINITKVLFNETNIDGDIICLLSTGKKYYNFGESNWLIVPEITAVYDTNLGGGVHQYIIGGNNYPGAYFNLKITISIPGEGTTETIEGIYSNDDLISGITINRDLNGVEDIANSIEFEMQSFSLSCDYGSSIYLIEYD